MVPQRLRKPEAPSGGFFYLKAEKNSGEYIRLGEFTDYAKVTFDLKRRPVVTYATEVSAFLK